jgi:hypothetical protein
MSGGAQPSWGTVVGGRILLAGKVTNKLQGLLDAPEGNVLFHAGLLARQCPETLTDITQLSYPDGAGRTILAAAQRAVVSGNPHTVNILAKCVEAAALYGTDPLKPDTLNKKIVEALRVSANRLGRIPIKEEVHVEVDLLAGGSKKVKGKSFSDHANFSKALAAAGLDWLPIRL